MSTLYSETAHVSGWGSAPYARRVTHLIYAERKAVLEGRQVRIAGCPLIVAVRSA
jgi:hypothetical protein